MATFGDRHFREFARLVRAVAVSNVRKARQYRRARARPRAAYDARTREWAHALRTDGFVVIADYRPGHVVRRVYRDLPERFGGRVRQVRVAGGGPYRYTVATLPEIAAYLGAAWQSGGGR